MPRESLGVFSFHYSLVVLVISAGLHIGYLGFLSSRVLCELLSFLLKFCEMSI